MKSKNQSSEVIEVEAEEVPLDKVIDTALVKQNVTQAVIDNLKKEYGGLKLRSLEDKESYLEIKAAKKNVRSIGILVEKVCKAGREDAIKIQKLWLSKEKEVLAKIAEVENPLQLELDRYESEEARKLAEEVQRKENVYMQRQTILLKLGAAYANGCIISDDVTYDTDTLKNTQDDIFEEVILPKYKRIYEVKEVSRIAEEKRKADAAEQLRIDQDKLAKEKRELEEARAELKKEKDEADRIRREEDNKIAEAKRKVSNDRLQKLMSVVSYDSIDRESISTYTDDEFNTLLSEKTVAFENKKKEDEEKRLAYIEEEKQLFAKEALRKENERIEKEKADLEAKRIKEEQEEAERIAQANDKTKLLHIIEQLKIITFPEMKSPAYKTKVATIKKKIQECIDL